MTIKLPEPCHMAISYDGKTPYSFPFEEDCEILDLEVKRLGGTASKLNLYTEAQLKQAIKDALEEAAQSCISLQDCGPDNGCCPTYWNEALEKAEIEIRKLKDQL